MLGLKDEEIGLGCWFGCISLVEVAALVVIIWAAVHFIAKFW